ncbi:MAG: efflux RND transporter periplasmic adaptor subunit [Nodosilinea sp.]
MTSAPHKYLGSRLLGLTLTVSVLAAACGSRQPQAGPPPAVPVKLQVLQPGTFEDSSEFVGALEAETRVELKPQVDGRISQIYVASGDPVNPGQNIFQIDPTQSQAEMSGAQAGAEAARFGREAAQAQLQAAQAEVIRAQADLELATAEFGRIERLVTAGAVSRQDLDRARNELNVAQAAQKQAQESVRAAQSELQRADSTFNQAQAQVDVNQESLGFNLVTSPMAGFVGDFTLRVGDFVDVGQTITTIVQNQELFLRIQVPTTRSAQLRTGLPVELLDPQMGTPLATGSLIFVSPDVNTSAQSILVKARFPNDAGNLRDGQSVRARVIWSTTTALLVPTVAVSRLGGQSFVYVADEQTTEDGQTMQVASQRPVRLGSIQEGSYQVLEGLEAGDDVVVTNILKLQDGVPITPEAQASSSLP